MNTSSITASTLSPECEPVPLVLDYYDGPLRGVAHYQGVPHLFFFDDEIRRASTPEEREAWKVDEVRDWAYALYPMTPGLLEELLEQQAILERWEQAWRDKLVSTDTPAPLPEDQARHDVLQAKLEPLLETLRQQAPACVKIGHFGRMADCSLTEQGSGAQTTFEVQWLEPRT